MSVADKLDAAWHSFSGSNVAKTVCKATSREIMGPKKKHVDCEYIVKSMIIHYGSIFFLPWYFRGIYGIWLYCKNTGCNLHVPLNSGMDSNL